MDGLQIAVSYFTNFIFLKKMTFKSLIVLIPLLPLSAFG